MTTARIGDITMYYEERGEGESLLLIPGLGTDVTDYRRIIDSLAHVCRVVAIDNRGAGRTDKPDTHPRECVAAIAEFLSQNTFITAEPIVRPQPDGCSGRLAR